MSKSSLRCLIRKASVAHTPEEEVRQSILSHLLHKGLYPEGLISIERGLLAPNAPKRRSDILVYSGDLKPLLLIECKATPLNSAAYRQVIGYNYYVKAPLLALVNQNEAVTGVLDTQKGWVFTAGLPSYADATKLAHGCSQEK